MRSKLIRATAAVWLLANVAMLTGCSNKYAREETLPDSGTTMTGTVTYGGEPVAYGLVRVKGEGREAAAKIGEDGKFTVLNCPIGPVTIGVNTAAGRGDHQAAMRAAGVHKGLDSKGKDKVNLKFVDVPPKYIEPDTSGLTHTLVAGENKHDIVIKK